jgi:hypothetical protein
MRAAVNVFALLSAAAALQAAPPAAAAAEDAARSQRSAQEGADQWVPSLSVISGLTIQDWEGALASSCMPCSPPVPGGGPLREPASGSDLDVTPYVGGSLELMTPELPIPASPRLFVGGEISATFGSERALASEGNPGTLASPLPEGAVSTPFGEDVVLGQGSETVAQLDSPIYGAYAGIAFPFELYGRQLRVKPSFAWIRYRVDVEGLVVDAECQPQPLFGGTQCNTELPNGFLREIRLQGSGSATFDGIGPGLDIELDTGRAGPVGTSLFLGARAYHILGDRKIEFGDSQSFDDQLGTDETRARWSFEADAWMYRVGIGMRFQWLGFAD